MDLDTCEGFRCDFLRTRISNNQPVYGHKLVLIGHLIYVWGGCHFTDDKNRIWILNLCSFTWRVHRVKNYSNTGTFVDMMFVKDDIIYGLSRLPFTADRILVEIDALEPAEVIPVETSYQPKLNSGCCGAFHEERQELVAIKSDATVHVLDMTSFRWIRARTEGNAPFMLGNLACCSYGDTLYITDNGGAATRAISLNILTAESASFRWSTARVGSFVPRSLDGVTLTCSGPHRIFAFGGTRESSEVYVYSVREGRWRYLSQTASSDTEMECFGELRGGTLSHAAVQTNESLLILGGRGMHYWLSSPLKISPLRNR